MAYRPKGWVNPHGAFTSDGRYDIFEDGADAMLEALRKSGVPFTMTITQKIMGELPKASVPGQWVFIPDDEVKL